MPPPASSLRCRQIAEADIAAVAALLARGFPHRDQQFWLRAFAQLTRRDPPPGLPKYGYLLESAGVPVGALLLICSMVHADGTTVPRCNLSSWYVEPTFRTYAPLLVSQALRHKDVTYLNVSPAPNTLPIIEAQGFARYCDGVFVAVPMLNGPFGSGGTKVFAAERQPEVGFDPLEQELLLQHAAVGCISLWCTHAQSAYPFVFRTRRVKSTVPCAQLIYCRDIADFVRFAGPIGRFLALRGRPIVIVDANGPIAGVLGVFFRGTAPKYFRGPLRPRLGDLAYTEYALLGV
jgi:hypothetical protein